MAIPVLYIYIYTCSTTVLCDYANLHEESNVSRNIQMSSSVHVAQLMTNTKACSNTALLRMVDDHEAEHYPSSRLVIQGTCLK